MMPSPRLVVIGASLGGVDAVSWLLGQLPADFALAVAVVQHRGENSGDELATLLGRGTPIPLVEASDRTSIEPGCVVLAPAGYHLLVDEDAFSLSTEDRVHGARPSIDALFGSAARSFGEACIAVALTSASIDGVEGAVQVEAAGGSVLVQDPSSSASPVLPDATLRACARAQSLKLQEISEYLLSEATGGA